GVDRAGGVGAADVYARVPLLEVLRHPADRAAGADRGDEDVNLAPGLLPELRAGHLVVGARVLRVEVLVRLEGPGDLARQALGDAVVALRRVALDRGGGDHHLRAV